MAAPLIFSKLLPSVRFAPSRSFVGILSAVPPCFVSRLAKERARLKKHEKEGKIQPDSEIVKSLLGMFSENVSCYICTCCSAVPPCCGVELCHFVRSFFLFQHSVREEIDAKSCSFRPNGGGAIALELSSVLSSPSGRANSHRFVIRKSIALAAVRGLL